MAEGLSDLLGFASVVFATLSGIALILWALRGFGLEIEFKGKEDDDE